MKESILNTMVQACVLFVLLFSLVAIAEADELSSRLESHFDANSPFKFLNYESIDQSHADEFGGMRYLVMDFDLRLASHDEQNSIHRICNTLLKDYALLRQLTEQGFDMVSVSLDRQSQYDCL
jgi:hypothetical protein